MAVQSSTNPDALLTGTKERPRQESGGSTCRVRSLKPSEAVRGAEGWRKEQEEITLDPAQDKGKPQ